MWGLKVDENLGSRSDGILDMSWSNYNDVNRRHPKRWFSKGNLLISGKSRLVKYYNLARYVKGTVFLFGLPSLKLTEQLAPEN